MRSASGPACAAKAGDCGVDVEQRAIGIEDENRRHGILRVVRLICIGARSVAENRFPLFGIMR